MYDNRRDIRTAARPARRQKTASALRVAQICPSVGLACGVGNFSANLEQALISRGVDVATHPRLPRLSKDVLLVQHEFALYRSHELKAWLSGWPGPRALFVHSPGADIFADDVDGFISMCAGMTHSAKPTLVLPHPGWQSLPLLDRADLKRELGWSNDRCVVGTNGFISPSRQFDAVVERFLPFAEQHDVLVHVLCPRHGSHDDRPGYRDQEARLIELERRHKQHLQLERGFLDQHSLNRRLQACDLLWCWTATPSAPYGSGTCSDQYGSGSRLVVADKLQHSHVGRLPNVVLTPPNLDDLVATLQREVLAQRFDRHDPSDLSWANFADRLRDFLRTLKARPRLGSRSGLHDAPACDAGALRTKSPARLPADDTAVARSMAGQRFRCRQTGCRARTVVLAPSGRVGNAWGRETTLWSINHGRLVFTAGDGTLRFLFESQSGGQWASIGPCGSRVTMKLVPEARS